MNFDRKRKTAVAVAAVAALVTLVAVGAALAVSALLVDNAITVNRGNFKSEHGLIKLKTRGPVRIRDISSTAVPPGIVANWHTHPGPILVAMADTTAGSLTIYDEDCHGTTISAGQAFIETPNEPVFVRNNSSSNADWVTTMIIPPGVGHSVFLNPPPPPCSP
jgi:quercetin dioxygenase-like cupin family protein